MYYSLVGRDLELSNQDVADLDEVSGRTIPYPRWIVLPHHIAEEERDRALNPGRYAEGIPWEDRRFAQGRSS